MKTLTHEQMVAVNGGIKWSRILITAGAGLIGGAIGGIAGAIIGAAIVEELMD